MSIREKKIIRDPSQQLPNYITNIKCKVCDKETRFLNWKNGTDRCEKPPYNLYTQWCGYDCKSSVHI